MDDDPSFTRLVKQTLQAAFPGIEFSEVQDAEGLEKKIRSGSTDIIICGLRSDSLKYPDLTGRILNASGSIPVILFSDVDDVSVAMAALKLGVCDYIVRSEAGLSLLADAVSELTAAGLHEGGQSYAQSRNSMRRQFRHIFDRAPLGYQSLDAAGCIVDVNPAWTQTLGYTREEAVGKWFGNFLATEYVDAFRRRFPVFLENGQVHSEFEMIHKDGSRKSIAFDGRVGYYSDGSFDRTYCILQDLTESRQMERLLRESEEKYRHITENITDVVWTADLELKKNYVSSSVTRLTGFSPEEYVSLPLERKFTPDALETIHEIMVKELENETNPDSDRMRSRIFEVQQYRSDGHSIWVEMNVSFLRDVDGKPVGIQGITRDISLRKSMEEKLQANLNLLKIAGRAAKFGGWSIKKGDQRVVWSENVAAIHEVEPGFSPLIEEAISFYLPEWRSRISELFTQCMNEGIPYDEEMEIMTVRGNRKWIRTIGEAIRDGQGEIAAIHGAFQDITKIKLAEKKLEESRQAQVRLISNLPGIAYRSRYEPAWTMEYISNGCLEVTGYSPLDFSSRKTVWGDIILDEDRSRIWEEISYAVQRKEYFEVEYRIRHLNGEVRYLWEKGSGIYDKNGEPVAVEGFIQDVTSRKLAGEALRESEQNYRELINGMTETVWVLDFDGRLLDVNETAVRLLEYSKEELLSGGLMLVDSGLDWDKIMHLVKTIPDDRIQIFETVHRTREGRKFPVEIYSSVINHRKQKAILSIARDITERKQTENELRSLKEDLEKKVEEKTRELRDRVEELERFHQATIDRELRMKELREELNILKLTIQKMKG